MGPQLCAHRRGRRPRAACSTWPTASGWRWRAARAASSCTTAMARRCPQRLQAAAVPEPTTWGLMGLSASRSYSAGGAPPASLISLPARGSRRSGAPRAGRRCRLRQQLGVAAALLDDAAGVHHDEGGPAQRWWRGGGRSRSRSCLPSSCRGSPGWRLRPRSRARWSLRRAPRCGASLGITRAMAMRWRWPPLSLTPRSPTWASMPRRPLGRTGPR